MHKNKGRYLVRYFYWYRLLLKRTRFSIEIEHVNILSLHCSAFVVYFYQWNIVIITHTHKGAHPFVQTKPMPIMVFFFICRYFATNLSRSSQIGFDLSGAKCTVVKQTGHMLNFIYPVKNSRNCSWIFEFQIRTKFGFRLSSEFGLLFKFRLRALVFSFRFNYECANGWDLNLQFDVTYRHTTITKFLLEMRFCGLWISIKFDCHTFMLGKLILSMVLKLFSLLRWIIYNYESILPHFQYENLFIDFHENTL